MRQICDKTKNDLYESLRVGRLQLPLNNAFFGFVALLHEIEKWTKVNPLRSRLIRGFWRAIDNIDISVLGGGA